MYSFITHNIPIFKWWLTTNMIIPIFKQYGMKTKQNGQQQKNRILQTAVSILCWFQQTTVAKFNPKAIPFIKWRLKNFILLTFSGYFYIA